MEITLEKSFEQAKFITAIQRAFKELDLEYLEEAYKQMKEHHGMRESAMILDPNPLTAVDRSAIEAAKLKQMRLYLDAAQNLKNIEEAEERLKNSFKNINRLEDLFR